MPGLFVSYRRDDSQGFAGRLADDLGATFGPEHVFSDVEIPVGSDFSTVLHRAIADCDALLVIIGRHWVGRSEPGNRSRLFEPDDWVRTEIEAAFQQGVWIVPVLVGGATMPPAEALPDSLQPLTRIQAAVLSDRLWDKDLAEIIDLLRSRLASLPAAKPQVPAPSPAADAWTAPPRDRAPAQMGVRSSLLGRAGRAIGRGLRRVLILLTLALLLYFGLRLFGDTATLHMLDVFDTRLMTAWARLREYTGRW